MKPYTFSIALLLFILLPFGVFGQQNKFSEMDSLMIVAKGGDTIEVFYYDLKLNSILSSKKEPRFVGFLQDNDNGESELKVYRIKTEKLIMIGIEIANGEVLDGDFTHYWSNGNVESSGKYKEGMKIGAWERYTYLGTQRPDKFYSKKRHRLLAQHKR